MSEPFEDPLAGVLWAARQQSRPVSLPGDAWSDVDNNRAKAIADELYRRCAAYDSGAWKLGALDEETQRRLGLDRPLVAPVLPDRLLTGATEISLGAGSLTQPRLEPEIGVWNGRQGLRFVPCVEVADCRFAGWRVPAGAAVADFGLQGALLFGPALPRVARVRVVVRHDGRTVVTSERRYDEAVERLSYLPASQRQDRYVATGAMTALLDAQPGRWEFEFNGLTTLTVLVH